MSFHHSDVIPMSFRHSVIIPSFHNHSVHTHTPPPMVIFYHPFVIWVVRLSFHHSWVILSFLSHSASFLLPSMALPKSLEIFCANKHSSQVIPEWLRNEGICHSKIIPCQNGLGWQRWGMRLLVSFDHHSVRNDPGMMDFVIPTSSCHSRRRMNEMK